MYKPNIAELLAKARAARTSAEISSPAASTESLTPQPSENTVTEDRYGNLITYNNEQQQFINLATSLCSCILMGAAGTGKTTCMRGTLQALISSCKIPFLKADDHKHLQEGTPGIVVVAYTRRAVNNIRKVMPPEMKNNCITIHKLLEYEPVYEEAIDPETGDSYSRLSFQPTRNKSRPLSELIHTIVIEESSMVGTSLYAELCAALDHSVQFIFLGDIQQLPPVFGPAILGFKLLELPTIELTQVYRQALESPIIKLAHRILSGTPIPLEEFPEWKYPEKLTLHAWKKKISPDDALKTAANFFTKAIDSQIYNIEEDIILIPFNKSFGTIELNKHIAQHIARKQQKETYEIQVGFEKIYLSVGDKVLYDKEDAEIIDIRHNPLYLGKRTQKHSLTLDYWGYNSAGTQYDELTDEEVELMLDQVDSGEERVKKSSHIVTVKLYDSSREVELSSVGDVTSLSLGYCLTIHKAQGSEWRKVFLVLHQSHATMLQRELLYTGVTRAKEELYVICEPDTFVKGITNQRIKGDTLAAKAEYFKGRLEAGTNKQ